MKGPHKYEVRPGRDKSSKDQWWEVMRLDAESGKTIRVMGQWEFKHQAIAVAAIMRKYAGSELR